MVTRNSLTSSSGKFSGYDLADDLAEKAELWFNNMSLIPTTIVNSGNDYTITIDPPLKPSTDVVAGMTFHIIPNTDNTDDVRLRVTNTGSYYPVLKATGAVLASGEWNQQTSYHVLFIEGNFRILNLTASDTTGGLINEQVFNASGIWTKPVDVPLSAMVEVALWGGGGGSGMVGGVRAPSGGGAGIIKTFKITELASTVAVTVGNGGSGTYGGVGGTSSFGTLMVAYGGGQGGSGASIQPSGGGGGLTSAGAPPSGSIGGQGGSGAGGGMNGTTGTAGSSNGGGIGRCGGGGSSLDNAGQGGDSIFGGGGGGYAKGGDTVYGGGGGCNLAAGGLSVFGGQGAGNVNPAQAPGGGGSGANATTAPGGQGRCRVRIIL